jgi:peptidyl-prolyl cis-trans isomerase B (cyclophilin B)
MTALLLGVDTTGYASSAAALSAFVSPELVENGVSIESLRIENGKVIIKVDGEEAPETARNFRNLVASGFYDGLTIFRAQRGFVVQGGEDKNIPLTPIKGEFDSNGHINNISHKRGVISMARTGEPNSATSQFFITLNDSAASSLDGEYAGFGWVVEGMDVIDAIAADLYGHAINYMGFVEDKNAIKIKSASIIEYEE